MVDILNLALPYFGLIFIGFACGKAKGPPEQGLAWMNFFLLYVSLPTLLFGIAPTDTIAPISGIATPYSITSSARPSNDWGTVRPNALAVLRLMIISTFVARWTGRSAGFSPLRI
jgi:hypothetical protein